MDQESIRKALRDDVALGVDKIQVLDEIDSTNAELMRQLRAGCAGSCLLLARSQSAGRGRRGRHWSSPMDGGIYLSLCWPWSTDPLALQGLSLVAAISVHTVVQALGVDAVQLKWPNDLLLGKQKLAGILLEYHRGPTAKHVVFGIGINLSLAPAVRENIGRPVIDLASLLGADINKVALVAAVVNELVVNTQRFEREGFAGFQQSWNNNDRYFGQDIIVQDGNRRMIGKSRGVDSSGALILQSATGQELVTGGEIFPSLRALEETSGS
jgi:BirA family transcriptional regulator, biotin operon repressor / biotin---[acetyl-CoA-carboxylase] ligase